MGLKKKGKIKNETISPGGLGWYEIFIELFTAWLRALDLCLP